jgi:hypothetical protein
LSNTDRSRVFKVDPSTGRVRAVLDLRVNGTSEEEYPPGPHGIAVGGDIVWVTLGTKT